MDIRYENMKYMVVIVNYFTIIKGNHIKFKYEIKKTKRSFSISSTVYDTCSISLKTRGTTVNTANLTTVIRQPVVQLRI